jgi:hypothetical protein
MVVNADCFVVFVRFEEERRKERKHSVSDVVVVVSFGNKTNKQTRDQRGLFS